MSNVDSRVVPTVSIATTLESGEWNTVPYLWPNRYVNNTVAPEVPVANLSYDFGTIKRTDKVASQVFPPLEDLHGQFVRIQTDYEGAVETNFVGVIETVETQVLSNVRKTGRQNITAYGLAHLLDRVPIKTAFVEGFASVEIMWTPDFNRRDRFGGQIFGNRSLGAIGPQATHLFAEHPEWEETEVWTNADIIRYLVAHFAPVDLAVSLQGQHTALNSIIEVHNQGKWRSLWDALVQLIDRKRGVGFSVDVDEQVQTVDIRVFTIASTDITVGSATLPANDRQQTFQLPTSLPLVHLVDVVPFKETIINQASKLIVRGQRVKATGTFSWADDTLKFGWDLSWGATVQSDYKNALLKGDKDADPSQRNKDMKRTASRYGGLWTRFVVPQFWSWRVGDGLGDAITEYLSIGPNNDGTFSQFSDGDWNGHKKFVRQTPFLVGWDYTVDPPVPFATPEHTQPEYQSMMVFINDTFTHTDGLQNHEPTQQSYHVDRIPIDRVKSAGYRPLDDMMGFELNIHPLHYFAGDDFRGEDLTYVEVAPEFDWRQLVCTATVELDVRQMIESDLAPTTGGKPRKPATADRTIVVDVPDAEYWYVAPNTAIDTKLAIVETGNRLTDPYVRANDGGSMVLRDDKVKLEGIAAFMQAWYQVKRQAVKIPIHRARNWVPVGTLITNITSVDEITEVNTVVTKVTTVFPEGAQGGEASTTIETGWASLDSLGIASRMLG